jgi:hypothetical protein
MTEIEDLEKLKFQKLKEIEELNNKISQISFEKMVKELKLEEGKYYEIRSKKYSIVYFKFTKDCKLSKEKHTITLPKAINVTFTRALYSVAYTKNFAYDISFSEIEEISKEEFEETVKKAKENLNSLMEKEKE